MEDKKTHTERKVPGLSIRSLADYMAATERGRRTVIRDCKYRATVKVVQHDEAKLAASKYMRSGANDPEQLHAQAEYIRNKLADDTFDADVNDHNADYVDSFATVAENVQIPLGATLIKPVKFEPLMINGVRLRFSPDLLVQRTSKKTNKVKSGALFLRYAKGKALSPKVGCYQSAAVFGALREYAGADDEDVDKPLCLTLDAFSGATYPAPGDAITIFHNMKAACATIAELWDNIKPPPNAVL